MFDPEDRVWLERSSYVPDGEVEVLFLLSKTFYGGDLKQYRPDAENVTPLPGFSDEAAAHEVPTAKALGREQDVLHHYRSLLRLAEANGRSFKDIQPHFWQRLVIGGSEGVVRFSWYDTWEEMKGVIDWLATANSGDDWYDVDQGWELHIVRQGARFHFREGSGEGEEFCNLAVGVEAIQSSIAQLKLRFYRIIEVLSEELGADLWTAHGASTRLPQVVTR
jgi:hypothetical protein